MFIYDDYEREVSMTTTTEPAPARTVPGLTGISHVGLTVRDVEVSEAWYAEVLGLVRLFVEPHSAGEGHAVVMTRPGTALYLGLDYHPDADQQMFHERRTGLDHLALGVGSRSDVDRWITHLDTCGIEHSPVVEVDEPTPHAQLTFRDPDGIPIEVFWIGGE